MYMELLFAMHFILQKLEDPEFVFKIESEEHLSSIQVCHFLQQDSIFETLDFFQLNGWWVIGLNS